MNNAGIQKREQWNMVCDGVLCHLDRRAYAEMLAWFFYQERTTGMGAYVSVAELL